MFLALVFLDGVPAWKRAAGVVGLLVSIAGMIAAFVPGSDVSNVAWYEVKLLAGSVLPLAVGLAFFLRTRRRARAKASVNPER